MNYHVLNPEKYPVATFPGSDQTQEAVENLLKQAGEDPTNGDILTEEVSYHVKHLFCPNKIIEIHITNIMNVRKT